MCARMSLARVILALAAGLCLAAVARDRFDIWIDDTRLPPLVVASSVQVLDREGALLRAYTVADGRWRFDPSVPEYKALKKGEFRSLFVPVKVSDEAGGVSVARLQFTVVGTQP